MSVDGTDIPIQEPKPFHPKWFSHKINGPALRYELAVSCGSGAIVWFNGPFAAGANPDNSIFRRGLKNQLLDNEVVIADNGYTDAKTLCREDAIEFEQYHSDIRARHETVNMRLKRFRVLSTKFRHDIQLHGVCAHAVAQLAQLNISVQEPLFSVHT